MAQTDWLGQKVGGCSLNVIFMQQNDMISFIGYLSYCFASFFENSDVKISQGDVIATRLRYGQICNDHSFSHFLLSLSV